MRRLRGLAFCGRKVTQLEFAALQLARAYYPAKRGVPSSTGRGRHDRNAVSFPPELAPAADNVVGVFLSGEGNPRWFLPLCATSTPCLPPRPRRRTLQRRQGSIEHFASDNPCPGKSSLRAGLRGLKLFDRSRVRQHNQPSSGDCGQDHGNRCDVKEDGPRELYAARVIAT